MGRKGVSKRKQKSGPVSSGNVSGSSNGRPSERSPAQLLVKDKDAPFSRNGMNHLAGSNKSQKKC